MDFWPVCIVTKLKLKTWVSFASVRVVVIQFISRFTLHLSYAVIMHFDLVCMLMLIGPILDDKLRETFLKP